MWTAGGRPSMSRLVAWRGPLVSRFVRKGCSEVFGWTFELQNSTQMHPGPAGHRTSFDHWIYPPLEPQTFSGIQFKRSVKL